MINIEYRDGLLFTTLVIEFRGARKIIDSIVVDTGAAETILSPDVVEDIGIFAEPNDFIHSFYGVGGSLHNFFSKSVDRLLLGDVPLNKIKLDFGMIDPHGNINGLLGLDILIQLKASIQLQDFTLHLNASD